MFCFCLFTPVPSYAPRIVGGWPSSLLLTEGLSYDIPCNFDGWPTPSVSWVRNGSQIATNGTLYFSPVVRADVGRYVCVAVNTQATVGSVPINITVACK